MAVVPTVPEYSSLNLAQAALVFLYELHVLTDDADRPLAERPPRPRNRHREKTSRKCTGLCEAGLGAIQFFKARKPEAVMRTLRAILGQADLDRREARLIAGIGYETAHFVRRMGASHGRAPLLHR